ncbi:MAG: cobalamin-binding protein [Acidimicrobiia bacterium]|nr:cobalamin-binding protein [Acidimicrobiia bacterium]MYD41655.1 cobalamin-binding protein [Acidimicrobiia bacterium]
MPSETGRSRSVSEHGTSPLPPARVLVAKSSLDGHWRGVAVVARALREAGFEVILGGMLRPSEMASVAAAEDVDLVGINVGGRVEVVERALDEMEAAGLGDVPVFVGGTVPPQAIPRLSTRGVRVFPPGSSLSAIVEEARRLTGRDSPAQQL